MAGEVLDAQAFLAGVAKCHAEHTQMMHAIALVVANHVEQFFAEGAHTIGLGIAPQAVDREADQIDVIVMDLEDTVAGQAMDDGVGCSDDRDRVVGFAIAYSIDVLIIVSGLQMNCVARLGELEGMLNRAESAKRRLAAVVIVALRIDKVVDAVRLRRAGQAKKPSQPNQCNALNHISVTPIRHGERAALAGEDALQWQMEAGQDVAAAQFAGAGDGLASATRHRLRDSRLRQIAPVDLPARTSPRHDASRLRLCAGLGQASARAR